MIKSPGKQATRLEQILIANLIEKRSEYEQIIIHHITEDTPRNLQVEVEFRCPENGISFERIYL